LHGLAAGAALRTRGPIPSTWIRTANVKAFCTLLGLFALGLGMGADARAAYRITDATGAVVEFPQAPQRIVSLQPSFAETVCALGACARIVGVDRYTIWPAELDKLPRVGGGLEPSVDAISALKPDLVLVSSYSRGVARLRAAGLKVVALKARSHEQIRALFDTVAGILGQPSENAARTWQIIDDEIAQSARSIPDRTLARRLYFAAANCGPYAASESSFVGEIVRKMSLTNVVDRSQGDFPKLSADFIAREQPDVLLLSADNARLLRADPRWSGFDAVRSGKVCVFTPGQTEIFSHHGPRMGQAARLIAQCLQGKIASDLGE
jgi:iron complex transport system substrate-binding protein